jgi:four helix bundle protein
MGKSNGLRALELAQLIVQEILEAIESFPAKDPAGLGHQLAKTANAVAANLAEGYGRSTPNERRNKLRISRGELAETQNHLKASGRSKYMPLKKFYRIWNLTQVLDRMLAKLMRRD